jgi:hypothetical protein
MEDEEQSNAHPYKFGSSMTIDQEVLFDREGKFPPLD